MVTSMTGYGQCELTQNGVAVSVELRSVNNRFLEISLRMPRELNHRETEIREIVRGVLSRGKINLNITVERATGDAAVVGVDIGRVKAYVSALEKVREAAEIAAPIELSNLLVFADDIVRRDEQAGDDEAFWKLVSSAVEQATRGLDQMRTNEGSELERELLGRIAGIDAIIEQIEPLSQARIPLERERLQGKIGELIASEKLDPMRLEFEVTMLADKYDITEEFVRYRSHSKYFVDAVNSPEPAGRKLGFLLQEINREITTIGSKTNDAQISQLVVCAKEELEKIREQVQNIE